MTKTLTRADIADAVYTELGLSYVESADLVDAVIDEIIEELTAHRSVKLSSFGTFDIRQKNARMGRNPKTKESIPITARSVVSFHASNILSKRVNKNIS